MFTDLFHDISNVVIYVDNLLIYADSVKNYVMRYLRKC